MPFSALRRIHVSLHDARRRASHHQRLLRWPRKRASGVAPERSPGVRLSRCSRANVAQNPAAPSRRRGRRLVLDRERISARARRRSRVDDRHSLRRAAGRGPRPRQQEVQLFADQRLQSAPCARLAPHRPIFVFFSCLLQSSLAHGHISRSFFSRLRIRCLIRATRSTRKRATARERAIVWARCRLGRAARAVAAAKNGYRRVVAIWTSSALVEFPTSLSSPFF